MASYEWVLKTPKTKEFERTVTKAVEIDVPVIAESGVPAIQRVKKEFSEVVKTESSANLVRLTVVHNDVPHHRLFVRFFYGRIEDGKFVTPEFDDGVVFGGPTYLEHEFHDNPSALEELALLKKIAAVLKWDGQPRQIPTAP